MLLGSHFHRLLLNPVEMIIFSVLYNLFLFFFFFFSGHILVIYMDLVFSHNSLDPKFYILNQIS